MDPTSPVCREAVEFLVRAPHPLSPPAIIASALHRASQLSTGHRHCLHTALAATLLFPFANFNLHAAHTVAARGPGAGVGPGPGGVGESRSSGIAPGRRPQARRHSKVWRLSAALLRFRVDECLAHASLLCVVPMDRQVSAAAEVLREELGDAESEVRCAPCKAAWGARRHSFLPLSGGLLVSAVEPRPTGTLSRFSAPSEVRKPRGDGD